jgi:hypothetical protein
VVSTVRGVIVAVVRFPLDPPPPSGTVDPDRIEAG